ncbi:MAG: hypothetical protein JWP27_2037 [Flaviaesturariibacter sp.]|nr:hypothetical protein [Flaviaesturariibacter sp.]
MKKWILSCVLLLSLSGFGQDTARAVADGWKQPDSSHARAWQRRVDIAAGLIYTGWFVMLNETWYKDYPRSSFHFFNDIGEWQQVDKVGHAWTVYTASRIGYGMWRRAGAGNRKAVMNATLSSTAYLLAIEYLDGRSAEWGFSWGDAGADIFGAALFGAQQLAWDKQLVQFKFSSHPISYPDELKARTKSLFGSSLLERTLKDYNAQAYWMSMRLPRSWNLPKWLQVSVGYGAGGMLGGYENTATDAEGHMVFDRRDIRRYRQWYLAPDIDLTQIRTRSGLLRTVFFTLNSIKFPAPTLELSNGRLRGHFLYF